IRSAPSGPGPSAPAWASTQAAADWEAQQAGIQRTWQDERDRLDREATAEQNRLAEEAVTKRNRLGVLSDLIQGFLSAQTQSRADLARLENPFRFAAVAGGIMPFGVTPHEGLRTQLQQFASASAPQLAQDAGMAQIDAAIAGLQGAQQPPQAPPMFGMAEGGVIEMRKGSDGSYEMAPSPYKAYLVGEGRHGEGITAGTAEVIIPTSRGITVIPLAGGMQAGGTIGFPFEPIKYDVETMMPALATSGIFGSLGLGGIPTRTGFTAGGESVTGNFGALSRLGIQPRFVRDLESGKIFRTEGGTRQWVSNPQAMAGINPADIMAGLPSEIARFAPTLGTPLSTLPQQQIPTTQPSAFTRRPVPIIEPTTGTLLPAPFMVASQLNKLLLTNPNAFNLLLSAYDAAGEPAMSVLSTMQAALPTGRERGIIGMR
ncbi:hypothetical protein LCGC14_2619890, partial [marine sediment metagenome]